MIVRIENGLVIVEKYGLSPGIYKLADLSAEELVDERDILNTKIMYGRKISPTKAEVIEMNRLEKLVEKLSWIITKKCQCLVKEINKAVLEDVNENLGKG